MNQRSEHSTEQSILDLRSKEEINHQDFFDNSTSKLLHAGASSPSDYDLADMNKQERKRYREKKRRERVNASFEELRSLLIRVDPQCSNRVDIPQIELVDRSVAIINQLIHENQKCKQVLLQGVALQQAKSPQGSPAPFVDPFENDDASPCAVGMALQQQHSMVQQQPSVMRQLVNNTSPDRPPAQQHQHQQPTLLFQFIPTQDVQPSQLIPIQPTSEHLQSAQHLLNQQLQQQQQTPPQYYTATQQEHNTMQQQQHSVFNKTTTTNPDPTATFLFARHHDQIKKPPI